MITRRTLEKKNSRKQRRAFLETLKGESTSTSKSEEKKEKKQHIKSNEGCLLLAEAIVKQAKKDFIKHPKDTMHHQSSKCFVMSEWFKTITLGAADSKKTLDSWEDDKYVYDIWKEVKFRPMFTKEEAKAIGKMFRDKIHTSNVILWDYLSYLNAEGYLVDSVDDCLTDSVDDRLTDVDITKVNWDDIEKHADLLKHYGWEYITDSADRCQAFKPVKTNNGYRITMRTPLYLTRTEPKKEVE